MQLFPYVWHTSKTSIIITILGWYGHLEYQPRIQQRVDLRKLVIFDETQRTAIQSYDFWLYAP